MIKAFCISFGNLVAFFAVSDGLFETSNLGLALTAQLKRYPCLFGQFM